MNHPVDLLTLDWANPLVRKFMNVYPEKASTVSEPWQAVKYTKELDYCDLSPMWADFENPSKLSKHFYVNELAHGTNSEFLIPLRFLIMKGEVYAEIRKVHPYIHPYVQLDSIVVTVLLRRWADLERPLLEPVTMPHPVRVLADGRPAFVLRIMAWSDDVSGNTSKQYNAHMNLYAANICLPHRKLCQEYFVRFCATSQQASSPELFDAVSSDCKPDAWREAYDCQLGTEIIFRIQIHLLPADNPQQAESTSTAGSNATLWCRSDLSGGSAEERETDEGYEALFSPGVPRTPDSTINTIRRQLRAACTGVETAVTKIQTETGVKDRIAQFWIHQLIPKSRQLQEDRLYNAVTRDPHLNDRKFKGPERDAFKAKIQADIEAELFQWLVEQPATDTFCEGVNPHQDTPGEILHTELLGNDKYIWHATTKTWDKRKDDVFAIRLQSSSIDGLSVPPIRASYMLQYKNSLIGKHFKTLQQVGAFHLRDDFCSKPLFELWKANGLLGAMLWYPEIRNMDTYLADLKILIANVLDLWAQVDPSRIILKYKLHVLSHLPDDIRRFGPAVLFSTEVFECWNAVFRLCSILSNHQAPSHDIASTIADMERFKHVVSGGWWKHDNGSYGQAGNRVRSFLIANRELQRRLGWVDDDLLKPGTVRLHACAKQHRAQWREAIADVNNLLHETPPSTKDQWSRCRFIIARNGDVCMEGSWVFCNSRSPSLLVGRVVRILTSDSGTKDTLSIQANHTIVLVEQFDLLDQKDARLDMPVLRRPANSVVLPVNDVLFHFNSQHDCYSGNCAITEDSRPVPMERLDSSKVKYTVSHADDARYIINMHALHNAHVLREVLPRTLIAPSYVVEDRAALHRDAASKLRVSGPAKRAETVAKSKATRARNKAAADGG
ncbi:hypothetical protein PC9H_011267 [Pleurotus ostreatus]|uniref:Uncharacterized protein n=1 Tax=Pleurotus ostreatus TaxID=5322 RepID=A0A8H7DP46_PLEOS|nr:uncharacterized protein PC9H_011267 [Pleurotus ostreatus]KAF7420749.1 hypothetical protein PC9H_011267 [Pleurotus ostreatus]